MSTAVVKKVWILGHPVTSAGEYAYISTKEVKNMRIRRLREPEMNGAEMHARQPERHLELHLTRFISEQVMDEGAARISRMRSARRTMEQPGTAVEAKES